MSAEIELLERNVVASLLVDPSLLDHCGELRATMFTDPDARAWFAGSAELWERDRVGGVDSVAFDADLPPEAGHRLLDTVASLDPVTIAWWAETISAEHRRRVLAAELASAAASLANDRTVNADEVIHHVVDLAYRSTSTTSLTGDRLGDVAARLVNEPVLETIPTGVEAFDEALGGGYANGRMIVVAGRPGMGKSSVCHLVAYEVAASGRPVVLMSREMAAEEVALRVLSFRTGSSTEQLQQRPLSGEVITEIERLQDLGVWVLPYEADTIDALAAAVRSIRGSTGIAPLVVVDHIGLMRAPAAESRQLAVAQIAEGLKDLAIRENTPVIALSQLNRGLETRVDKRPLLADLRESGAIEQSADTIMFLYREDVYDPHEPGGTIELIVAKNRAGPTRSVLTSWDAARFRFGAHTKNLQPEVPEVF